jgi:hypothetical protein
MKIGKDEMKKTFGGFSYHRKRGETWGRDHTGLRFTYLGSLFKRDNPIGS